MFICLVYFSDFGNAFFDNSQKLRQIMVCDFLRKSKNAIRFDQTSRGSYIIQNILQQLLTISRNLIDNHRNAILSGVVGLN